MLRDLMIAGYVTPCNFSCNLCRKKNREKLDLLYTDKQLFNLHYFPSNDVISIPNLKNNAFNLLLHSRTNYNRFKAFIQKKHVYLTFTSATKHLRGYGIHCILVAANDQLCFHFQESDLDKTKLFLSIVVTALGYSQTY